MTLKKSALTLGILSALTLAACSDPAPENADVASDAAIDAPTTADDAVSTLISVEISVAELQTAMTNGELTAVAITEHYIDRINKLDKTTNSVMEINPDALAIAMQLDEERAAGRVRSALHGIPVLLKDNIDTADHMKTTAGSLALFGAPTPSGDAFLVQQLRDAGAVILGKTNLSEWANFRSSHSSSGWSARGGQTHNAYNADITPCGSSSGSGVAVAANFTVLAVGTETDGSIICPASNNSVVGIKPTLGLISRSGVIPIAHSQDTAGPMARSVADAAALLTVMAGVDPADSVTLNVATSEPTDYSNFLQTGALAGKRIGVMRSLFGRNAEVDALMEQQLEIMSNAGATIIDLDIRNTPEINAAEYQVLLFEFKDGLNKYLTKRGSFYQSLEHLIRFNDVNRDTQMPHFAQEIFVEAQAKTDLQDPVYLAALNTAKIGSQGILDGALQGNDLDAIVAPSNGPGWPIDLENGDNGGAVNYVSSAGLAAISGYPAITVPAGYINGLPVGISFMGSAFSEPVLIGIAYDFEQKTLARRAPE
ncbi:MAG: amidase [Pseudohongiella sp.]|nr:amidase [Pseudohongiella sp.]MDO9520220.1 amidase [Pseudohongiella sp.]MDP2125901.1 amidase [Pseudohongiella sp.]